MNLKPLLFVALMAAGSMTGFAQKAAPATVSETSTVASSLKKSVAAFEKAGETSTAKEVFEQIKVEMKAALHAAKKDLAAKEPMTDEVRNAEMAKFMKLENAYFDVMKNTEEISDNKPGMVTKLKAFTALLK